MRTLKNPFVLFIALLFLATILPTSMISQTMQTNAAKADSLNKDYFEKGLTVFNKNTFKYSPEAIEKLRSAISNYGEVINSYKQKPPKNESEINELNRAYSSSANIYLSLGQYATQSPAEFARAEELFKLALPKSKAPSWVNLRLVLCLTGQYKFYEARDLAKRVLASTGEEDFRPVLSIITGAFDMMGEYHFADAFLTEIAGIRQAANKSLKPIAEVKNDRRGALKAAEEFADPKTVMELNRKVALLVFNSQQCDKAIPLLEKANKISENPTSARIGMFCLYNQKNYEQAWQVSNNLVDFNRSDVMALTLRGTLNGMQDDVPKAEADMANAIRLFPELAASFGAFNTAKQIYQFHKNTPRVNEIEALEKKLADLNAQIANQGKSDPIGDILDEDEKNESKPTPTKTPEPISTQAQENLQKLNQLLKTINIGDDNGVADIIDGRLYFRFKDGSSRSLRLQDISNVGLPYKPSDANWVSLFCKDGKRCVNYSDNTRESVDNYRFFANSVSKTTELLTVLNNLLGNFQPTSAPIAKKPGTLADCKIILSDGCRNYFMQATINDLRSQFTLRESSADFYRGEGFEVSVEPSSGGVLKVKFYKSFGKKPADNIKWGDKVSKVQEKYGQGKYSRFTNEYLDFDGIKMEFWSGELSFINFERDRTASELVAYNIRQGMNYEAKAETERAEAAREALITPQEKAKRIAAQMQSDYNELLDQLDAKLREGDRIVKSERLAIATGGVFAKAVKNKLDKVRRSGDSLIDTFGKKYQGKIPAWMVKGIQEKWRPVSYPQ